MNHISSKQIAGYPCGWLPYHLTILLSFCRGTLPRPTLNLAMRYSRSSYVQHFILICTKLWVARYGRGCLSSSPQHSLISVCYFQAPSSVKQFALLFQREKYRRYIYRQTRYLSKFLFNLFWFSRLAKHLAVLWCYKLGLLSQNKATLHCLSIPKQE